jgi:hypothetical protein
MMEKGEHTQALAIFERLARAVHDRGMIRPAANLYLQAGRASLLAGETGRGESFLMEGLGIFSTEKRWPALARTGKRLIDETNQHGHSEIAEKIKLWLDKTLPKPLESYAQPKQPIKQLPLKCPSCGGALRPNEVEMLDEVTGECPYCGSGVRGE